jgi:hypothetical protein
MQAFRQQLRQHLDGGVGDTEQRTIRKWKYLPRLAIDRDPHYLSILGHVNARALERQQHQVIDLPTQQAHNAFQLEEVKDELVCGSSSPCTATRAR